MKQREPISKIMQTEVHTVHTAQELSDAYELMSEHKVHHVPVVDGKRLIGIISSIDVMRHAYGNVYAQDPRAAKLALNLTSIREAMTEDIVTLSAGAYIKDAANELGRGDLHALPVVNDAGDLIGIVTSTDLIRFLGELY